MIGGCPQKKVNVYSHLRKDEEETPGEQDDHPHLNPKRYRTSPCGSPFQAQEQQQGDWEQPTWICKWHIMPAKCALCGEMTGSVHRESTREVVYLEVCKVFNAVSLYFCCKIRGIHRLQDGWETVQITRLKK